MTGIIRAFNAIEAGGMGDPRALSGGIAEALIATARACAWRFPRSSPTATCAAGSSGIVVEMEKQAIRMADALEAARRASAAAAARPAACSR